MSHRLRRLTGELTRRSAREQRRRLRALRALSGEPAPGYFESLVSMPSEQSQVVMALRVFQWFRNPENTSPKPQVHQKLRGRARAE